MAVTEKEMSAWCEMLLAGSAAAPHVSLADYIRAIPGMASLADLPSGTVVLVRGDVDAKPGPSIGDGDIRLRSMVDTLQFGQKHGWKQIIFGHIGRKPEGSLNKVAKRLGEIMKIPFARPRERACVLEDRRYYGLRSGVIDFLEEHALQSAVA